MRHDYQVGQEIAFGDVRGRISRIYSTSTILDAGEGRSIRIPNHLLLDEIVTISQGGTTTRVSLAYASLTCVDVASYSVQVT